MRDYEEFLSRLRYVLSLDGTIESSGMGGGAQVTFVGLEGRRFEFIQSLGQIYSAVGRLDSEVLADPQDISDMQAQLRLFSVHVKEAVETAPDGARFFEVRSSGVWAH
ncbi:hypothetical protein [Arthrobacter celericrescens]|uniref:hypothetical protein n=1 Tax=Arthrobacter celericrescens TaxID=2320851 RepID=UPI000EA2076C|nr:hypothetical protein [Arthrobacter celericrescens]